MKAFLCLILTRLMLIKINRLVMFQNTCLLSVTQHAHTLNKWMIRFLIEYALPFDGKVPGVVTPTTPHEFKIISTETQKLAEQGRFTTFPLSGVSV